MFNNPKESRKGEREEITEKNKMVDLNPNISMINIKWKCSTYNYKLVCHIDMYDPTTGYLKETHFKYDHRSRLKIKGWKHMSTEKPVYEPSQNY